MKVEIIRKNIKNIRVSATTETLLVSAPKHIKEEEILKIVKEHEKELVKLIENQRDKKYLNNIEKKEIYLFGDLLEESKAIELDSEEKIENFYRKNLELILVDIFKKYNEITGLVQKEYKIRKMKSRWGTCYTKRGLININLYVVKRPIEEIELVVLHELVHLKHPNHSSVFYEELEKFMPKHREIKRRLNE